MALAALGSPCRISHFSIRRPLFFCVSKVGSSSSGNGSSTVAVGCPTFVESLGSGAHEHSLVADGEYNGKGPKWKKLSSSELGITTSMISRPIRVVLNALKKKASDETDHLARLLKTSAKHRQKKHFYLFPRNQSSFFFSSQALSLAEYPTFMGGLEPSSFFDSHSYARCLQNCVQNNDFVSLRSIHGEIVKKGNCLDLFAMNILLNGYVKSRCLSEAYKLFNEMPERNTISFVTLIQGLMQDLMFKDAVDLFVRIHRDGHEMNAFVFTTLLNLLVSVEGADNCDAVHASICKLGLERDAFVGTALIDAYSLCGNVCGAKKVFDVIAHKDLVSWTGMLSCLAENGFFEDTIAMFSRMRKLDFKPNNYTFASVLKGCIGLEDYKLGRSIHGCILKLRYELDLYVGVGLLEIYSKIGSMNDAERVFEEIPNKDVIHWSFMIGRFSQAENSIKAVGLFLDMRRASIVPNQFTFASTLQACAAIECLELGQQLHCLAIIIGLDSEIYVLNALMDVFAKCGRINTAFDIFTEAKTRNDVTYNTMIVGYAQMGEGQRALSMFSDMWECQLQASEVTYSGALHACAGLAALEPGNQIHSLAVKTMYDKVTVVGNSLIDMYVKCGPIKDGRLVFDKMRIKDEVSWNTLISGYSMHGLSWEALEIFKLMEESGCKPNNVTFVGVLSACSNAGLLDQGRAYFESMASDYGIKPSIEHYTCMVWLLGRRGDLDEALKLILEIPYRPSVMVWRALLSACVIHRNVELGKLSAQRVLEIEPQDEAAHVLLSNIYANARRWDKVAFVRKNMTKLGVKKEPGLSWVEYQGAIHCFTVGDSTHPDSKLISGMLELLNMKTKREGYVSNPIAVLLNVEDEEKEHMLWAHSERVALAFGLIRMPRGSPIRIIKNLRICVDCHAAVKMISKLVQREIIIRDMNRFHHFQSGNCSCGDYCLNSFCLLHHAHPHALDELLINGLSSLGYDVYLVGGCVRDLILKRIPKDFDIITSAELKEVRNTFPRCEVIGRRFPICHVHVNDTIIEVSSFNTSGRNSLWRFNSPIKKPSGYNDRDYVRWRNCLKRDFTINGLMFDPYAKIIYDYIGGMEDLRKAKVRTVIPADLSFVEDCARILRAFRVAARLGFHFTREIAFSLRELSHSVLTLDKGRIFMEMNYMLAFGSGEASLRLLWRFGLLELLLPIQASYFVSQGFKRRDKGSNMLLGLFANLDKVVAPDRPCHSSLWVALLAFHKALVDQPREPTVVAAFALAIYSGGSTTESIKIARGISQQHGSCHLELLEPEAPISKLRMMNEVVDLAATVKDVLFNMTNRQYVSQAMKKYPQAPRSDLVFISEALLQRVCNIFECVKRGMGGGSVPARSRIDYNSLTSGRLQEVRHAFARIVFDTVYPVSHQSDAQLVEHHNPKMEELSDIRRDLVVQEVH